MGFSGMSHCHKICRRAERGFSLIEIAIALAIIGLLLIPFIHQYNIDAQVKKINQTRANISVAEAALKKYAVRYGRYPRPASLSIGPQNPAFGVEAPLAAYPACAPNIAAVCQGVGLRDANPVNGLNDPFYVGAIPFAAIGIPQEASIDGFGNKLTYTVSQSLTNTATFNDSAGILRLQDDLNIPLDTANNTVHFVIISHGSDGKGAFSLDGAQANPCGLSAAARDNENCDNDAIFDYGLQQSNGRVGKSLGNNPGYWNDYYTYASSLNSDIWTPITNDTRMRSGSNVTAIRVNTPTGDPLVRVEVNGNVRSEKINTPTLCVKASGSGTCIPPDVIGRDTAPVAPAVSSDQPGIRCPANSAMTGIANSNQQCGSLKITNPAAVVPAACPVGQFPAGIDATGQITCASP
jgi:prepilin-type N-terminal cleavage/methylation domain-containing protein